MAHTYSIDDEVHHRRQGPQLRDLPGPRAVYTITRCLPIEGDGRVRYRIKSGNENVLDLQVVSLPPLAGRK